MNAADAAYRLLGGGYGRWLLIVALSSIPAAAALVLTRRYLRRSIERARVFSTGYARSLLIIAILATPALASVALMRLYLHASPNDFVANSPNDFPDYWHEIATFRAVGFRGGYYTASEVPPRATFTHFGDHGPAYVALLGTAARLTGWNEASPVFYNIAFITAGLALFIWIGRPDGFQLVLTFLSVLTCWPLLLMLPTAAQESLHQAGALVLAAIFWGRWLRDTPNRRVWALAATALIVCLSLVRFSWTLLLLPLIVIEFGADPRRRLIAAVLALVLMGALIWVWGWLAAPGLNLIFDGVQALRSDPVGALRAGAGILRASLGNFMARPLLDCLVRLQMLALTVGIPAAFVAHVRSDPRKRSGFFPAGWLHWFNAAPILCLVVLLYPYPGVFRLFSVAIVFSWFGFILSRHYALAVAAIASQLFLSASAGSMMFEWTPNFDVSPVVLARLNRVFTSTLVYAPPPASPWCNTILLSSATFAGRVTQIPAGFGLSTFNPADLPQGRLKSKYLILTPAELGSLSRTANLRTVAPLPDVPDGSLSLVLNLESQCRS